MGSNPLIQVEEETKKFLESEKKRLEGVLGREPTFDEVLKVHLDIDRDFRRVLQGRMDEDDEEGEPFLL